MSQKVYVHTFEPKKSAAQAEPTREHAVSVHHARESSHAAKEAPSQSTSPVARAYLPAILLGLAGVVSFAIGFAWGMAL